LLSYQHGYHAGNAADVHKHLTLVLLLQKLRAKDAAFCFVDAHAGRGLYDLDSEAARKTGEAAHGILKLVAATDPPASVCDYLDLVAGHNRPGSHRFYPGSALLAQALLREQDRALLLELHPQEVLALKEAMARDRRVSVHKRDCFEGLPALLPPRIRRGLVLLDPSYEIRSEYETVIDLLEQSLSRWSNGIYLLWYPLPRRRQRLHAARPHAQHPQRRQARRQHRRLPGVHDPALGLRRLRRGPPRRRRDLPRAQVGTQVALHVHGSGG
jgi:23S rRNA (adenine2030-N6)-methyltransferase